MEHLTSDFLSELFKFCFKKKEVLEVVKEHLKFNYIPSKLQEAKKVYKSLVTVYENTGEIPTYGQVSQQHGSDIKVQEYLNKIKKADTPTQDALMLEFESFVKNVRFQELFSNVKEKYNSDKQEQAIEDMAKGSEEIVKFNIKRESRRFLKLFEDFEANLEEKEKRKESGEFDKDKVPFGIKEVDEECYGGIDAGDTFCFLARSGIGKSTLLKWVGVYATRLGYDVLHIQLEGSKQECYDKYTQVWSALKFPQVKYGNIPEEKRSKLRRVISQMKAKDRDVYIYAFDMFDEANCRDVRDIILEYEKIKGKAPDLLLIDSIDLLHPGDNIRYGVDTNSIKYKKENSAKKLKNIATEFFPMRVGTVDQADNIPKDSWNDPTFVMTRNNVSGAKNLPNSFSYFITVNQTESEKEKGTIRLHFDKLRNYMPKNRTVKVATAYEYGRFYDAKRTKELKEEVDTTIKKVRGSRIKVKNLNKDA